MTQDEGRTDFAGTPEDDEEAIDEGAFAALFGDRRRVVGVVIAFLLVVVAIYVLLPRVIGFEDVLVRIGQATWYWLVVALAATGVAFAAYVALFRGILGGLSQSEIFNRLDLRASYQITMAGLAATRLFSAAGAGGIVVTYWALRHAGLRRRTAAARMVAFLVVMYSVYLGALVIFGVLLRTGVLPGMNPVGGTIVPAAIAGTLIGVILMLALIPADIERRLRRLAEGGRGERAARIAAKLATGPATVAGGVRTAISYLRHPRQGALAVGGAIGFWGANIATLWASFEAFGGDVPFAVLVQGFFLGMAANLIPSPAGGVGSVDAGMIAAFLLFGVPSEIVFPAVLVYRVMAFWAPIPPGVIAYFHLRRTVAGWDEQRAAYTSESKVMPAAT
ncbi:MAG: flippase-like domain-containing protein [Thermoleophilaceae bacterium]|nr:flippase-like domain-containing protein [Thermoleophilaceae bacterium]